MADLAEKGNTRRGGTGYGLAAALLIIVVTWLVFGQALCHDFLSNWDDPRYVFRNPTIRGFTLPHLRSVFSSFYVGNYAPLQMISYMLDYSLWGLNPAGFVATNITIHSLNGVLLWLLLTSMGSPAIPAMAGSLLFLLHPVQVESVVWISQRKNLLAMFFFLLSFLFYRRSRADGDSSPVVLYMLSVAAYVCALLSKSVAVILPLMLFVHDRLFFAGGALRRPWRRIAPYLLAAAAVGGVAVVSQAPEAGGGRVPYHGGNLLTTAMTMLPVFVRYVKLIAWPTGLSAVYEPPIKTAVDGEVIAGFGFLLLLIGIGVYLFRYGRREFFWYVTVLVGFLPVSQIIPIITLMNDRYLYFPMVGVAGLCSCVLGRLGERLDRPRICITLLAALVVVPLAIVSFLRTPVWCNARSLWRDAVAKSPDSFMAWYGLAEAEHEAGNLPQAKVAYLRSLSLKPESPEAVTNLGVVFMDMGEPETARQLLQPILRDHPGDVGTILNIGESYRLSGEVGEAELYFREAVRLKPDDPKPLAALGGIFLQRGDLPRSEQQFALAIKAGLGPEELAFYKAGIFARMGRAVKTVAALEEAERLGYTEFSSISWDKNFDPVRDAPGFRAFVRSRQAKEQKVGRRCFFRCRTADQQSPR